MSFQLDILSGGEGALDAAEWEGAKRSLVYEIIDREATVSDASTQSLLSYFQGVDRHYNRSDIPLFSLLLFTWVGFLHVGNLKQRICTKSEQFCDCRNLCQAVWKTGMDQALKAGVDYVKPLFDFDKCNRAIATHPSKINEVAEGYKK